MTILDVKVFCRAFDTSTMSHQMELKSQYLKYIFQLVLCVPSRSLREEFPRFVCNFSQVLFGKALAHICTFKTNTYTQCRYCYVSTDMVDEPDDMPESLLL